MWRLGRPRWLVVVAWFGEWGVSSWTGSRVARWRGGATAESNRVDVFGLAEEWARRGAADARQLASMVREAESPSEDFGARALAVAHRAVAGFDEASQGDDSSARQTARASLARTIAGVLAPAHAEHLATVRGHIVRRLRAALAEVDDAAFVDSSADIAAQADLAFRNALAAATPDVFLDAWRPALDAAYAALRDDFREAFEDRDLARKPVLPPPADDDDDLQSDNLQSDDDDDLDDAEPRINPFLFKHPRLHRIIAFARPRWLQILGLLLNVIQARAAIRAATRAAEQRDTDLPKLPLF
mmetsp:Transcript_16827/g.52601  ORF Transcript_16827/g.52601 Transcript_16827/m.52601 type:complete len:300 (+) Transcript_16827:33-932(+)